MEPGTSGLYLIVYIEAEESIQQKILGEASSKKIPVSKKNSQNAIFKKSRKVTNNKAAYWWYFS